MCAHCAMALDYHRVDRAACIVFLTEAEFGIPDRIAWSHSGYTPMEEGLTSGTKLG